MISKIEIDIRDAFFDELYDIAINDKNVMVLTSDMGAFGLEKFKNHLNEQYKNIGVAEQNIISIGAGLALEGRNVFIYGISSFITMRCYEQIKIDISCANLPVKIMGSGPGITYDSDGPTHHAIQDISIMRALPNMIIFNASDPSTATSIMKSAYESKNPVYIRIDKGKFPKLYSNEHDFSEGLSMLKKGKDILIITTGLMVHDALKLVDKLAKYSIDAGIIDIYKIKPINDKLLLSFMQQYDKIVILEEHSIIGGICSIVSEILVDNEKNIPVKKFAISDKYCTGYGDREWMHSYYGLDTESVSNEILQWLKIKI